MKHIGILIPHFNRTESLKSCLGSIDRAALKADIRFSAIVLDDSPYESRKTVFSICDDQTNWCSRNSHGSSVVPMWFRFRSGKPQWSLKFNDGYSLLASVYEPFDFLAIISCDFVLDDSWFLTTLHAFGRHKDPSMICAPGLHRRTAPDRVPCGPITSGDTLLTEHAVADNGMCWVFHPNHWLDWDEEFDRIGYSHQVPEWLWRMSKNLEFWRCDDLNEKHIDHENDNKAHPEWLQQVLESEALYHRKIGGGRG